MKHHLGAHKYIKRKLKKGAYTVWKCMIPGCPSYVKDELAENHMTVCWICGKETLLDKIAMMRTRPHCRGCKRGGVKEEPILDSSIDLLTQLFGKEEAS